MLLTMSLNVFDESVPQEDGIRRLAEAGFQGADFNGCDVLEEIAGREDADAHVRGLHDAAQAAGVRFVQMHGPIFNPFDAPEKVRPQLELSLQGLRWAQVLGIPWVVFHPYALPGPYDAAHLLEMRDANAGFVRRLLSLAEQMGVGIAIENSVDGYGEGRRAYCSTPGELVDLVDAINHRLVGICWDTGHAHLQRLGQERALRALGSRLKCTHIADNDGSGDQHILPYHGRIRWSEVMTGLYAINYAGAFAYVPHNAIRVLPDCLRDEALRYAASLGRYLIEEV